MLKKFNFKVVSINYKKSKKNEAIHTKNNKRTYLLTYNLQNIAKKLVLIDFLNILQTVKQPLTMCFFFVLKNWVMFD